MPIRHMVLGHPDIFTSSTPSQSRRCTLLISQLGRHALILLEAINQLPDFKVVEVIGLKPMINQPTRAAVLNLWAAAHWWAADLCPVGREQGWELRNLLNLSHNP